ncbi:hypothetical protein PENARI_c034G01232 [Penicillium arizonense]|uniref:Uncharacterized protein n=1 Tax=Penicillium arizonense TaxID=1835702 RepID=A0A1F5L4Y4_PENAI|nr:hypothetical protein PENARI_c034G01232 [Penicillium arizonense]OGE47989.1 hypothetical protein PENARI_c034G01232 [Penicillium arizonense]
MSTIQHGGPRRAYGWIMVLAQSLVQRPEKNLGSVLDQWLLDDTVRPVAELLKNQLLEFHLDCTEVPPVHVRWYRAGQTGIYQDVTLRLTELPTIIWQNTSSRSSDDFRVRW